MRWMRSPALLAFVVVLSGPLGAESSVAEHRLCRFVLADERDERDDLELDLDLARLESAAEEEIYALIDRLWKQDAIERMVFLLAKHEREAARLEIERRRLRLQRQEAVIDQYRHLCALLAEGGESKQHRQEVDAAFDRYHTAQCGVIEHDVAIAEVDLEYLREFLESVRNLRQGDVATLQDVIRAERDVEMARKRLERGKRRAEGCRAP